MLALVTEIDSMQNLIHDLELLVGGYCRTHTCIFGSNLANIVIIIVILVVKKREAKDKYAIICF